MHRSSSAQLKSAASDLKDAASHIGQAATQAWKGSRDVALVAGDKAADTARTLSTRWQRLYPRLHVHLPNISATRQRLRDLFSSAADHAHESSLTLAYRFRRAESWSLRLGAVYLVYKLFRSRNTKVAEVNVAVRKHVYEKPVESAFIALGIGYVLGKLIR